MPTILIVYYSKTGNTRKMAEAIAQGAKEIEGVDVIVKRAEETTNDDLLKADAIILGSPTYFRLPAWPLKKLIDESIEVYGKLRGKLGGVFTSTATHYGGEICLRALRDALEEHGITVVGEGVIAIEEPSEEEIEACKHYGRMIAERLKNLKG